MPVPAPTTYLIYNVKTVVLRNLLCSEAHLGPSGDGGLSQNLQTRWYQARRSQGQEESHQVSEPVDLYGPNHRRGQKHLCVSLTCYVATHNGLNLSLKRKQRYWELFPVWCTMGGSSRLFGTNIYSVAWCDGSLLCGCWASKKASKSTSAEGPTQGRPGQPIIPGPGSKWFISLVTQVPLVSSAGLSLPLPPLLMSCFLCFLLSFMILPHDFCSMMPAYWHLWCHLRFSQRLVLPTLLFLGSSESGVLTMTPWNPLSRWLKVKLS